MAKRKKQKMVEDVILRFQVTRLGLAYDLQATFVLNKPL